MNEFNKIGQYEQVRSYQETMRFGNSLVLN